MKVTVLHESLNKGLGIVGRIATIRGQLPVLGNVLLEASMEGLVLSATNLEMGIRMEVGGKVTETGALTIPAKNLGELVTALPVGNIELVTDGEKMRVSGGKSTAVFTGIAATEFPVIPKLKDDETKGVKKRRFILNRQVVAEIAQQVAFAAATDESRPVLTGVRMAPEGKKMSVTATDGFRLSRKIIGEEAVNNWEGGIILPAKTILELARLVSEGKKEEVVVEKTEENNQIIFGHDKLQLVSRVLEGNFPDVDKLIPDEYKTEISVDREELLRAVRAVSIFARDNSNIIKLEIRDEKLRVFAAATQSGESETELETEKKGEDGEIAFNFRYVSDFLNSTTNDRVFLGMNGSLAPGVWRWEKDTDLVHLIMPVRV